MKVGRVADEGIGIRGIIVVTFIYGGTYKTWAGMVGTENGEKVIIGISLGTTIEKEFGKEETFY